MADKGPTGCDSDTNGVTEFTSCDIYGTTEFIIYVHGGKGLYYQQREITVDADTNQNRRGCYSSPVSMAIFTFATAAMVMKTIPINPLRRASFKAESMI